MLKLSILVLTLFGLSANANVKELNYGEKFQRLAETWHDTCIKKIAVEQSAIDGLRNGEFPDDPALKQYITCLWLTSGCMKADGSLNKTALFDSLPEQLRQTKRPKIISDCSENATGNNLDERVYDKMKCIYRSDPKNFIIF